MRRKKFQTTLYKKRTIRQFTKSILNVSLVGALLLLLGFVFLKGVLGIGQFIGSRIYDRFLPQKPKENGTLIRDTSGIVDYLLQETSKQEGVWGVYVYNVSDRTVYGLNEQRSFTAASVNKIPILLFFLTEVDKGTLLKETVYTLQTKDIQDYGTGTLRYQNPGSTYTVWELARFMMTYSDNTASYVLANMLGREKLQQFLNDQGYLTTVIQENTTTPLDIGRMLSDIYTGKYGSFVKKEALSMMNHPEKEDRLPVLLPKDVTVLHKDGTQVGAIHDAGVVLLPRRPYVVVILSEEVRDEAKATQFIQTLSKIIFEFESS